MDHNKLLESTTKFLDIATYQKNPLEAKPIVESPIVVESRIDDAVSHLDKMFGYSLHESKSKEIDSKVKKELDKLKQARLVENCCDDPVYTGKSNTGVTYHITQKSSNDFVVSFVRPNGGKAEMATYPTFQGALYMLQSQVPSLTAIKDDITPTFGVDQSSVTPIDTHSFDDLHESVDEPCAIKVGDTVETLKQGQQRGKVESIEKKNGITKVYHRHENGKLYATHPTNLKVVTEEKSAFSTAIQIILEQIEVDSLSSLSEDTQQEIISIATDLAPHILKG